MSQILLTLQGNCLFVFAQMTALRKTGLKKILLGLSLVGSAYAQEVSEEKLVEQWLLTERTIAQEKLDHIELEAHNAQLIEIYEKELVNLNEELEKAGKNAPNVTQEVDKNKAILEKTEKYERSLIF